MIWNKYVIETTTKDSEMAAAILMDQGINDIQIEDNIQLTDEELNQMYADFVKELPADDGSCRINFYLEFDENADNAAKQAKILDELKAAFKEGEELYGMDPVQIHGEVVDSVNWENNWKQYFKPFFVDDILIKPTWEEVPEGAQYKTSIDIDPGMAFGTGLHETTRLCIRGIRDNLKKGDTVLDLGCGSGILSIAAVKLGSGLVTAVDIDPQAVAVAEEKKKGYEKNFEEILVEFFPSMEKEMVDQVQEEQRVPYGINQRGNM